MRSREFEKSLKGLGESQSTMDEVGLEADAVALDNALFARGSKTPSSQRTGPERKPLSDGVPDFRSNASPTPLRRRSGGTSSIVPQDPQPVKTTRKKKPRRSRIAWPAMCSASEGQRSNPSADPKARTGAYDIIAGSFCQAWRTSGMCADVWESLAVCQIEENEVQDLDPWRQGRGWHQ